MRHGTAMPGIGWLGTPVGTTVTISAIRSGESVSQFARLGAGLLDFNRYRVGGRCDL